MHIRGGLFETLGRDGEMLGSVTRSLGRSINAAN
jgi:hypothetical protein